MSVTREQKDRMEKVRQGRECKMRRANQEMRIKFDMEQLGMKQISMSLRWVILWAGERVKVRKLALLGLARQKISSSQATHLGVPFA